MASVLVGIALFEVFHDVQYLSLVWIYNRKRVESDRSIGGFMRFVFRRSGALSGVYVRLGSRLRWAEFVQIVCRVSKPLSVFSRRGDRIGTAPFLLRRIHLESPRKIDATVLGY